VEIRKTKEVKGYSFLMAFVLFGLLTSCTGNAIYEKTFDFEDNIWKQRVKPVFKVNIKDTSKIYTFGITIRTSTEYKYSNLWIYLNTTTPDGQKVREPFEIKITNPDGSWIGKKTGTIVAHTIYFKNRKMPKPGLYFFEIEQGITETVVDEVLDIGLLVEEVSES
jgi:gliding motility-associated lipoprotein GldH